MGSLGSTILRLEQFIELKSSSALEAKIQKLKEPEGPNFFGKTKSPSGAVIPPRWGSSSARAGGRCLLLSFVYAMHARRPWPKLFLRPTCLRIFLDAILAPECWLIIQCQYVRTAKNDLSVAMAAFNCEVLLHGASLLRARFDVLQH